MTPEERQQHIDRLNWILEVHAFGGDSTAALTAAIESLEREGQMETLFTSAQALRTFCAHHEYPSLHSKEQQELTTLIDQLATQVRKMEAYDGITE